MTIATVVAHYRPTTFSLTFPNFPNFSLTNVNSPTFPVFPGSWSPCNYTHNTVIVIIIIIIRNLLKLNAKLIVDDSPSCTQLSESALACFEFYGFLHTDTVRRPPDRVL